MLMINEYGSAIKRAHSEEEVADLLSSGWKPYEKKQEIPHEPTKEEVTETVPAPKIVERKENPLLYKGRYLTQWVSVATKKELKAIFDARGIEYDANTSKSDMVKRLRQYIREVKAEQREERQNDGK